MNYGFLMLLNILMGFLLCDIMWMLLLFFFVMYILFIEFFFKLYGNFRFGFVYVYIVFFVLFMDVILFLL